MGWGVVAKAFNPSTLSKAQTNSVDWKGHSPTHWAACKLCSMLQVCSLWAATHVGKGFGNKVVFKISVKKKKSCVTLALITILYQQSLSRCQNIIVFSRICVKLLHDEIWHCQEKTCRTYFIYLLICLFINLYRCHSFFHISQDHI